MISDRDPQFTLHFGKSLTQKLGINQNLSMTAHPQTNGLSERKNQWIEQYLCIVTSNSPEDWPKWLSIATAVHNNRKNITMGLSPNQILLGHEATLIPGKDMMINNQTVEERVKRIED